MDVNKMNKNEYWETAKIFRNEIIEKVKIIFQIYNNELSLKLEEINLLNDPNNCIESSTAIGFILEEFIVQKLKNLSKNKKMFKFDIQRDNSGTTSKSFDFFSIFKQSHFFVNIKVNKGNNNAIAAINKLYKDYTKDEEQEKHYFVLKINYNFSSSDDQRKIYIKDVKGFFLEELDFSKGYLQDYRNWSKVFKAKSGRLQINDKFYREHKLEEKNITYEKFLYFLKNIMVEPESEFEE